MLLRFSPASCFQNNLHREEVSDALDRFVLKERAFIQRGLNNSSIYISMISEAFRREGLPGDLVWLPLIESGFSVHALSRAGAAGLWQFMPSTARHYRLRIDFWVDERLDPYKSTQKAVKLLKELYRFYHNWELTLAAYNAGMGAVNRAIEMGKTTDYWELCSMKLLRRETRDYVPRFYAAVHIARNPSLYGFTVNGLRGFPDYETLLAEKPLDLTILALKAEIQLDDLRFLNPELKRLITPIGEKYALRVPKYRFEQVVSVYHSLPEDEIHGLVWHTVKTGETLGEIAQRYETKVTLLKQINAISNSRMVQAGKKILVPVGSQTTVHSDAPFIPKRGFLTQEIVYTIREGDTIWRIAHRFRTDVETILSLNGLSFESIVMPGDRIILWIDIALQR